MGFWVDWELWQKMCFVLGGLIALVLVYGTCVHAYNSWRIKKIGAAEKIKKAEEEANIGTKDLNLIPFGSRALESGIEIEGIWVSKTNTPLPSPIPAATPETTRPCTPSNIELGAAALPSPRGGGSALGRRQDETLLTTNGLKAAVARGLDKNSSSESSSTRISYESSLSSPPNGAGTHQPKPLLSLEARRGILTHLDLIEGEGTEQTGLHAAPKAVHHSRNQSNSHIPVGDEDHLQALHTHRRSHVAETGQLGGPWRQQPVSA
ncbi:hypothetical protein H112_03915 [Trichophyton rubrum D6]|uniref:Uncharacterized protein n=4 Tax=Trichophyton TaxID=5550 RepID=A0A178EY12_TRIRU|nr:uncharacterized protein TERG_05245 [Trichophyton rubrum CBS 118892]EZF23472.1 hypothetical protein H100_03923 [Trichophyton rubrum MR850]EZF42630.1 hypothetical protein H102_03910 [Trichophyton rubrum CBS 100081]EZF53246.1 hypothetical protein H103_03924 [Trichophyton rubrum CBS 288.86]EZF63729.1 hypothetical protein H104_03909 [Trichophyton rubrum CBS 289.86]EZF74235.1 hypothetical protein H105_03938 [Trichophyton soudanense CBS 452.61]EZF85194.1 hypothetical protein H110_03916 [Trichophy